MMSRHLAQGWIFWIAFAIVFPLVMQPRARRWGASVLLVTIPMLVVIGFLPIIWSGERPLRPFVDLAIVQRAGVYATVFVAYLLAWLLLWRKRLASDIASAVCHYGGFVGQFYGMLNYFPDVVPKTHPSTIMFYLWTAWFVAPMLNGLFYLSLFLSYYYPNHPDAAKRFGGG